MEYRLKENIDYQYEGFSPYRAINIIKIGHISPSPPKKLNKPGFLEFLHAVTIFSQKTRFLGSRNYKYRVNCTRYRSFLVTATSPISNLPLPLTAIKSPDLTL